MRPVSGLSYEGRLRSHLSDRRLDGVEPGLHPVPVPHTGNSTSSVEEADAVVALVRGRARPAVDIRRARPHRSHRDNVIVVAPYNAQVELVRTRLRAAGLGDVPVGTVDKFQGQEAAVAIVSLAASSAEDVPRGLEFLLLANRLNVAISRAQWAAYLVYSPALTEYLPTNAGGVGAVERVHHSGGPAANPPPPPPPPGRGCSFPPPTPPPPPEPADPKRGRGPPAGFFLGVRVLLQKLQKRRERVIDPPPRRGEQDHVAVGGPGAY